MKFNFKDNKIIYIGAITLGVGAFLYYIVKANKKGIQDGSSQHNMLLNPTNAPLEQTIVVPTISKEKLKVLSTKLYNAFKGDGTTEEDVLDVFTYVKNEKDFENLTKEFGVKKIPGGYFTNAYTGNLQSVIKSEMEVKEIIAINKLLSSMGVSNQFVY